MNATELAPGFRLRAARPADRAAAYAVCRQTGDSGRDATALYREDPEALGHLYVGPYLLLEPELAFVLEDAQGVCGYLLGALDSERFYRRMEAEWLPPLRARIPDPTGPPEAWTPAQWLHHELHHFVPHYPPRFRTWPSHLHIDLLPRAQGRGLGRKMMALLLDRLATRGSPGVHLGVSAANERARRFYQRLGFAEVEQVAGRPHSTLYLARALGPTASV